MAEAAKALGVTRECIRLILNGRVKRSNKVKGKLSVECVELHIPTPEELFENLDGEEWRLCPSFPDYEVSSHGRLRKGFKLKTTSPNCNGYCHTGLIKDGKMYTIYVHRLVAEAFLPD